MAFRILLSACDDVVERQRHAERQPLENLDHHRMRRLDAAVQRLAASSRHSGVGKRRADALQDGRAHRTAARSYRWRRAPRPASSRDAARRPARTAAASRDRLRRAACCAPLHAFGRAQIDIDHDAGQIARGLLRNFRGRHRRPRPPTAGCWRVRCSDRSGRRRAAGGVWRRVWLALMASPKARECIWRQPMPDQVLRPLRGVLNGTFCNCAQFYGFRVP